MNRSILIVICDFLLVSLLVFSTPDVSRVTGSSSSAPSMKLTPATNQAATGKDLAAAMRVALDEETKRRDALLEELQKTKQTASQQEAMLNERTQQIQTYQSQLSEREKEAQQLQQQQAGLLQQFATAQSNIQTLNQQVLTSSTESQMSRDKLAETQDALKKQAEAAAALQKQLSQLADSNQVIQTERQRLATQLQVAEVEKRSATEQVTHMQEEVKTERDEKARLAANVGALASQSSNLVQEVHQNTALAPNTIFNDIITNRIQASFTVSRPGVFGDASKHKDTQTILVTDGTNIFALCHLQDTPLTLWRPGIDWQGLVGSLAGNTTVLPIHAMSFDEDDPRVVLVPISKADVRELGCKVYNISSDPYKFQDAVLIGARDGYYGECRFQIDLTTPQYVKLDRSVLKGLFGKFNPSSGDLVFSKNGEILGVMVNDSYCLMLHQLGASNTFQFGDDVRAQHTGTTLAKLYDQVTELPFKLQ